MDECYKAIGLQTQFKNNQTVKEAKNITDDQSICSTGPSKARFQSLEQEIEGYLHMNEVNHVSFWKDVGITAYPNLYKLANILEGVSGSIEF